MTGGATLESLRHDLEEPVPTMVPAHFVALERLPLNANASGSPLLPRPERAEGGPIAAVTETERAPGIWQACWRRRGATDNFFDIGGHSLKVTRLAMIRRLGVQCRSSAVFRSPTARDPRHLLTRPTMASAWPTKPWCRLGDRQTPCGAALPPEMRRAQLHPPRCCWRRCGYAFNFIERNHGRDYAIRSSRRIPTARTASSVTRQAATSRFMSPRNSSAADAASRTS